MDLRNSKDNPNPSFYGHEHGCLLDPWEDDVMISVSFGKVSSEKLARPSNDYICTIEIDLSMKKKLGECKTSYMC